MIRSAGAQRLPIVDYLVAAAALELSAAVIHYDRDYDTLAELIGFEPVWLASPGTLPRARAQPAPCAAWERASPSPCPATMSKAEALGVWLDGLRKSENEISEPGPQRRLPASRGA